jgi:chromosome segregation protein
MNAKGRDAGAHFYKCDFQVHSPRDARWSGGDAITDDERRAYSVELIKSCRVNGLDAIAITDHHDLAFFPFVRFAAQSELDDLGQSIATEDQITVFPGIELTLTSPTCQAILILDAAFPENLFQTVLTTLAITPSAREESRHATIQRIPQTIITDFSDLYEKLNNLDYLKERFIVFPNVSETGHGTLLRSGFANFYKTMPCVGAYVDGSFSKLGKGNLSIIRGENRDYGFKSVAVLQTSDNRSRDHAVLGKYTTWIKWSEPTAEALRQACLAKESRMSQEVPELPPLWISSLTVSNSRFLGRLKLEFNRQYNAIIGGRGTGKSTLLEYLRWGLCDQSIEDPDAESAPVQVRRKKLIDDTLQRFDGEVIVTFVMNDVNHILKRNSKTNEISLKIGDAAFRPTTEQEVRNLFGVQAYSQKQLSSVGVRIEELKRFVELPIRKTIERIRDQRRGLAAKIRSAYGKVVRKRQIEAESAKYDTEATSLTGQIAALRKGLKGLSEDDQNIIKQKVLYENEEGVIESLGSELSRAEECVRNLVEELTFSVEKSDGSELLNAAILKDVESEYSKKFEEIKKHLSILSELFSPTGLSDINAKLEGWRALKAGFDKRYEAAKANAKLNEHQLQQIQDVEARAKEVKRLQLANRNLLNGLVDSEQEFLRLREQWSQLHTENIAALNAQCQEFSNLSKGLIAADVKRSLDLDSLKATLKNAFSKLNVKESKIEEICNCLLKAEDTIGVWNQLLEVTSN